jgi:hypothetical protein
MDAIILAVLLQDHIHPYSSGSSVPYSPHHQQPALVTIVTGQALGIRVPLLAATQGGPLCKRERERLHSSQSVHDWA